MGPKTAPERHVSACNAPYVVTMRGAFVVRLASESEPGQDRFEGWIEEVDTAKQLRFRSAAELLQFMRERYALAKASDRIATRATDLSQRANPAGPEKD